MSSAPEPSSYPFPYPQRRATLAEAITAAGLDALLVTSLVNVRYLTGFTGSNAAVLIPADADAPARIATDSRYTEQVALEAPDLPAVKARAADTALLTEFGTARVGYEAHIVTVARHDDLRAATTPATELEPTRDVVETLRAVKDPAEIAALQQACEIADAALDVMLESGAVRTGRTEREVALELDHRMRLLGSTDVAFPTILAAGENSAVPHHQPTERPLKDGDLVKIDFGAVVAGYHSDMTRVVVIGAPAAWQRDLHGLVARAQQAGRDATRAGAVASDIDAAARDVIAAAGFAEQFGHGLGHGVGLEVHEAPAIAGSVAGMMDTDMTVTIEPGVYLPGRGGVRIEDTGVVTPDGYVPLTLSPRELITV